jgi:hypothetical protein
MTFKKPKESSHVPELQETEGESERIRAMGKLGASSKTIKERLEQII